MEFSESVETLEFSESVETLESSQFPLDSLESSIDIEDSFDSSEVGIENFNKAEGFASYLTASNWPEYVKVADCLEEDLLPQIERKKRFIYVGDYVIMENRISVWVVAHYKDRVPYKGARYTRKVFYRGHYMKLPN